MEPLTLTLEPIGTIHTPFTDRYRAPRQPGAGVSPAEGTIILLPGRNYEQALEDLEGFERIWVIYWFHRNSTWKPKVLPPRGGRNKRGLFATRSPHRPNPIGLSLLELLEVHGRTIRVRGVDLLDGTPVLDIKPYLPYAEAFPDARAGWLDEAEVAERESRHEVEWSPLAARQAAWLRERHGIDLAEIALPVLERDPTPHPYRRVERTAEGGLVIGVKSWRLYFHIEERRVVIDRVGSGYPPGAVPEVGDNVEAHREFQGLDLGT